MIYTNLAESLNRAKERSGAGEIDDIYLTELLNLSAGKDLNGLIHFRPFYVAANYIEQSSVYQTLKEADGVVFTGLATPITSLLNLQIAYDKSHNLTVPPGFEVILQGRSPIPFASSSVPLRAVI